MSQQYNLGKVALTPRGAYNANAAYEKLDIISNNGSSYLVLQSVTGVEPPNATYYMLLASKGDTGSAGASPTIAAGTVTMTPAGTSASVTNVGTNVNASFNFTLPNGNVIYTGTGVTGTSTTPTVFSGSGVSNAGVGDIYFNTSTVAFYRCALGGAASTAKWSFLTYAVPDGSVTTAKIADSAVTRNKIADDAVGIDEIENGSVSLYKLGSDVTTTLENKANVDGAYEQMTVGNAEQLVSTVGINDNAPYNFRTSGGSVDIGDRETDKVVGGTIAWNQQMREMSSGYYGADSSSTVSISDGVATVTPSARYGGIKASNNNLPQNIDGHKMLAVASVLSESMRVFITLNGINSSSSAPSQNWQTLYFLINADSTKNKNFRVRTSDDSDFSTFYVKNCMVFDLTAMFGSTIADYAYALESNTEGSGIAWLKSYGFLTKPYYAYDVGDLQSVNTSAHKTVGFNAYDNSTGKAKVVGGMVYQITGAYTALSLGGTSITPDANGYFTPSASGELTVTGGNGTTTCVHLKWDGERDGEYEAYTAHTYALDSDLELRGIPQLDESNNLRYDGDTYESDGTVTRRYGIVDLGTLDWEKPTATDYMNFYSNGISSVVKRPSTSSNKNIICSKYSCAPITTAGDNYIYIHTSGQIRVKDTSKTSLTADDFETAMSGVYLVYELDTPTTESADPYTNPQIVDDWGTEEYVDYGYYTGTRDVSIPVGHDTLYAANLRAKLEMSPNSPESSGDYLVRQTNGLNEYVSVSSNSIISGLSARCPSCQTDTDGNFVLKAVVSDGSVTYSWVSV